MRGKSLNPEQSQRVREIARSLAQERHHGNVAALARDLGLAQPTLAEFLNGNRGAGFKMLNALANMTGLSLDALRGPNNTSPTVSAEPPQPETPLRSAPAHHDSDTVLGNLPSFPQLLVVARQKRPNAPQWAWDAVAESRTQIPGLEASAAVLVVVVDLVMELVMPPPPGTKNNREYYRRKILETSRRES